MFRSQLGFNPLDDSFRKYFVCAGKVDGQWQSNELTCIVGFPLLSFSSTRLKP